MHLSYLTLIKPVVAPHHFPHLWPSHLEASAPLDLSVFAAFLDSLRVTVISSRGLSCRRILSDVGLLTVDAAKPEPEPEEELAFLAFKGTGMRLDGKPAGPSAPVPITRAASGVSIPRSNSNASVASTSGSQTDGDGSIRGANESSKPVAGKLVFGGAGGSLPRRAAGGPKVPTDTQPFPMSSWNLCRLLCLTR